MSINEINAEAKESLRSIFKDSNDVKHGNEGKRRINKRRNLSISSGRNQNFRNEIRTKKANEKHITT